MARISRRPRAERDVLDLWLYIAADNPSAADRLLVRIDAALVLLSENPAAGRDRSDLSPGMRSFPVGTYVLFYVPHPGGVELVRVLSAYRGIDSDLLA